MTHTIYLSVNKDGERELLSEWQLDRRARALPGRDKHGLMRPARDYAFERAWARMNKERREK